MRDNYITDMIYGGRPEALQQVSPSREVDVHWGSDVGFASPQGFNPPPSKKIQIAPGGAYTQIVGNALVFNEPCSPSTTRPSSAPTVKSEPGSRPVSKAKEAEAEADDQDSRPKKRRKSKFQEEAEEEVATVTVDGKAAGKKRKAGKKATVDSPAPESESQKRRKSNAAAAAKARENLTEDQKRENHIKSEQKRRTLIREGFEDLGELVPGLRGGGFSKSAVLIMAADWLEDLIKGNEELQRRIDQMEGR